MKSETVFNTEGYKCFMFPQRYMLPVNEREGEGSVTCVVIQAREGTRVDKFYYEFRKWLRSIGVPVVKYCTEANILEVLNCVEFPEAR